MEAPHFLAFPGGNRRIPPLRNSKHAEEEPEDADDVTVEAGGRRAKQACMQVLDMD